MERERARESHRDIGVHFNMSPGGATPLNPGSFLLSGLKNSTSAPTFAGAAKIASERLGLTGEP